MFELLWFATLPQLMLLYLVVLITLIYLLKKYGKSKLLILVILLFYPAIFAFVSKDIHDLYKIVTLILTFWVCSKNKAFSVFKKGDGLITFFFILFSLFYGFSTFKNDDSLTIIFSQYSRYVIAYCLWFLVRKELSKSSENIENLKQFTYSIILMQIVITIAKLIIFEGRQIESIVGSISHTGGAAGTTIPILGFIVLWFYKRGVFKRNDWLFVLGLMLVGFLAGKRAVWFIMPVVIATFMIYVPKLKMNKTLWMSIILAPVAFYLGMRLTPTLNPENKVWGTFDVDYAFDYADKYQFGDKTNTKDKRAQGRGGATLSLWNKWNSEKPLTVNDWFGVGLTIMYTTEYDEFDKLKLGINHKGSATGIFQTYITTGYIGIFSTILFFFFMLWRVKMRRIRWVLIGIVVWEYFLYTGLIIREPAYMFLLIYFIHYSNYLFPRSSSLLPAIDFQQRPNYLRFG